MVPIVKDLVVEDNGVAERGVKVLKNTCNLYKKS